MKKKHDSAGGSGPSGMGNSGGGKPGRLDREIQTKIGHQLRAMYDDVVKQGVPDHLGDIVRRFEQLEEKKD
jgi:hypothetical protein